VKRHLLCLTVDTDPDGLSGTVTNRQTLNWEGLEHLRHLPDELADIEGLLGRIPVTWFVRADGQLENILGSASYLLDAYSSLWTKVRMAGDEVGWHPHLYRQAKPDDVALLITKPAEAVEELERLWNKLKAGLPPTVFRNGEGWHTPETYSTVERLGFRCDSTAIPGRNGAAGHPMNWTNAPNQPYFPASDDLCQSGPWRRMLEVPMNTWRLQAPYDDAPKVRYMNPAVHPHLFANALKNWENACNISPTGFYIWVMIFHPDEVLATSGTDALYSRSMQGLCSNLASVGKSLERLGHRFEWVTVSDAAERWREHQQRMIA
jgi:hypothetical protein